MSRTGYARLSNEFWRNTKVRNVFAYASGIIGNRMEEASRMAQKRSE